MTRQAGVRSLYHVTQCARSLDVVAGYDRLLAPRQFVEGTYRTGRRAFFCRVRDVLLEIMVPDAGLTGLSRFTELYGDHYHSTAWYVDDLEATAAGLRSSGVRLFDTAGEKSLAGAAWPAWGGTGPVLFTNARDTGGIIEFKQRVQDDGSPEHAPWDATAAADGPLGITGLSHATVLAADLSAATRLWTQHLGGRVQGDGRNAEFGCTSRFLAIGQTGIVVELAQPGASGPARADLELTSSGGLFALYFAVRRLDDVRQHLKATGFGIAAENETSILVDSGWSGCPVVFTVNPRTKSGGDQSAHP